GAGAGAGAGLESSCVRLRLEQSDGHEFASGTIIDSRAGRSIILTCGHLFRDYQPRERLRGVGSAAGMTGSGVRLIVDVFDGRRSTSYAGRLLGHDLESDVGLVEISTRGVLPVAVVADPDSGISAGERLISFGCNGGDRPTRELVAVTRLNRYLGPDNVECTGVPLQGRSGGGLFDSAGRVVGVCFAADPTYQRGLYAGLQPIHDLLTRCHLTSLIANRDQPGSGRDAILTAARSPVTSNRSLDNVASLPTQPSPQPSPQPADRLGSVTPTTPTVPPRSTSSHRPTGASRSVSNVAEIQAALSAAAGAEVVCIIRSTSDPRAASRVVIINRASRKFVADLLGEVEGGARRTSGFEVRGSSGSGVSVTSPATAATRMQMPVIRGAGFSVRPGVVR
ncbi:MAG: serine protease, partial [Planctomycetaceae bacterium]